MFVAEKNNFCKGSQTGKAAGHNVCQAGFNNSHVSPYEGLRTSGHGLTHKY